MRKPHRVPDDRIAEEIAALDAFIDGCDRSSLMGTRFAMFASGARLALDWARDSRQADPMYPMRMLRLLQLAVPRVLEFERRPDTHTEGP